jgi:hypothetical protein
MAIQIEFFHFSPPPPLNFFFLFFKHVSGEGKKRTGGEGKGDGRLDGRHW